MHFKKSGEIQLTIVGLGRIAAEGFPESPEVEGWTPRIPKSWHWTGFHQLFQVRRIRMKTIRVMLAHCRKLEKRGSKSNLRWVSFLPTSQRLPYPFRNSPQLLNCSRSPTPFPSPPFAQATNLLPLFLLSTFLLFPRRFQVHRLCSSLPWHIH